MIGSWEWGPHKGIRLEESIRRGRYWSSLLSLPCEKMAKRHLASIYKPGRGPSWGNGIGQHLILDFPAPEMWGMNFCCLRHRIHLFFLMQTELINSVLKTPKTQLGRQFSTCTTSFYPFWSSPLPDSKFVWLQSPYSSLSPCTTSWYPNTGNSSRFSLRLIQSRNPFAYFPTVFLFNLLLFLVF